jgi:hypothetical protein
MKFVRFEEPILAMASAMKIEPVLRTDRENNFLSNETCQRETRMDRMLETLLEHGHWALEVARGEILFVWCGADDLVIEFDGRAGRSGDNFQGFGGRGNGDSKNEDEAGTQPVERVGHDRGSHAQVY